VLWRPRAKHRGICRALGHHGPGGLQLDIAQWRGRRLPPVGPVMRCRLPVQQLVSHVHARDMLPWRSLLLHIVLGLLRRGGVHQRDMLQPRGHALHLQRWLLLGGMQVRDVHALPLTRALQNGFPPQGVGVDAYVAATALWRQRREGNHFCVHFCIQGDRKITQNGEAPGAAALAQGT
jgi:hypothetical protein